MSTVGKIDYLEYTVKKIKVVTDLIIDLLTPKHIRRRKKYDQIFINIWKGCGLSAPGDKEGLPELVEFEEYEREMIFYFELPYGLIPDDFKIAGMEKRATWAIRAKEVKIEEDKDKHLLIVKVTY